MSNPEEEIILTEQDPVFTTEGEHLEPHIEKMENKGLIDYAQLDNIDNSRYKPEQRLAAIVAWLTTQSDYEASRMTGIPASTIKTWRNYAIWWRDQLNMIKADRQEELDARLSQLINKTTREIEDRLDNGEEVIYKDGQVQRKKVGARDLAIIAGTLYDKRALIRGDATSISSTNGTNDAMKTLEKRFEDMAKQLQAKTIDGEVVED